MHFRTAVEAQQAAADVNAAEQARMDKLESDLNRIQRDRKFERDGHARDTEAKLAKMRTLEKLTAEAEERERQARQLAVELAGLEPMEIEEPWQLVLGGGGPGPATSSWVQSLETRMQKAAQVMGSFGYIAMSLFRGDHPYQARPVGKTEPKFAALAKLLDVSDPWNLGIGRDVPEGPWKIDLNRYPNGQDGQQRSLQLAAAWSIQNTELLRKYKNEAISVKRQMDVLREHFPSGNFCRELETALDVLHTDLGLRIDSGLNEKLLLHGTKPETVHQLLSRGLSEKYSGGIFGMGLYFADTTTKNDQYTTEDAAYNSKNELHAELYSGPGDHPGKVHYVLVCRVVMGCIVRTQRRLPKGDLEDMDRGNGESVWAPGAARRELKKVPGNYPGARMNYHSLVAETLPRAQGGCVERHREFIQFNKERVYPAYLLAYRRVLQ